MIHKEHDFTINFCCAAGYDEEFHMNEIIIDELARLIVEDKKDVVTLLRSNNVNVTVNDSNRVVKDAVVKEIANENENVITAISNMVIKKQFDQEKYKSFVDAVGKSKEKKDRKLKDSLSKVIQNENVQEGASNLIAGGLKKLFNKNKKETTAKNDANIDERLKINEARQKEKINWKTIGLILLGIGVGSFIIYKIIKSRQNTTV
ncbi:MAG: hypothetical protein PHX80_04700 [Candidatus Nanoarchaeia archaeon]|nr:hypothetical protein [Candidatus Nanoarchaeia archaeon]